MKKTTTTLPFGGFASSGVPLRQIRSRIHEQYGQRTYALFHAPRFAVLLKLVTEHASMPSPKILDIGMSEFTDMMRDSFKVPIDTLDFRPDADSERGRQFFFDLTWCDQPEKWRSDMPQYDVVVMAEVIEHIYVSPKFQFDFLRSLLRPGGVLVLQTPNALTLQKRIKPLLGIHPYEKIRVEDKYGGHVREYTVKELRSYAEVAGFEVLQTTLGAYFDSRFKAYSGRTKSTIEAVLTDWLGQYLPPCLRPGITMVMRKQE
ncbi:MAG TPA: class I SAM-dependent methyltransferase [Fimbriimonadaceae bacterium]|nr:class I SAM-dependent methyltransferase [Fimbriimonadaceae bacterium]